MSKRANEMTAPNAPTSPNYFRIALESAVAAALCLGLPAGLNLWLLLWQQINPSTLIAVPLDFLQTHGLFRIYLLAFTSMIWGYLLGRISSYRPWWLLAVGSAIGILAAWFSPLANIDGILYNYRPDLPIHLNYAAAMAGIVGSATLFVGLAYGLLLRSLKAAVHIGITTSLVAIFTLLLTIFLFDRFGIRVGTGNFAMSKVTVTGLLTSAITGGMVLGVEFTRWRYEMTHGRRSQVSIDEIF